VKTVAVAASGRTFPVQLPIGYKLSAGGGNVLYEVNLVAAHCRPAALQGGAGATLYVVDA
jgi:hypothetical protein